MLEKLIDLIVWHARPDVKLTITVQRGSIQMGVEKLGRSKNDKPQWMTATQCGGESGGRDADALAIEVMASLAENTVSQAVTPKRES